MSENHSTFDLLQDEVWMPIPGFPGYEISNKARIRSYYRQQNRGRGHGRGYETLLCHEPQLILKPSPNPRGGHPRYGLCHNGKVACKQVGFWLLITFVSPWPGRGWYCCHNDGNCHNNVLENLRWDTKREDGLDRMRHGTSRVSHLVADDIRTIRQRLANGESLATIAADFHISVGNMKHIRAGTTWTWVK